MKITEQPDAGGKFVVVALEGRLVEESRDDFREHFSDPLRLNRRIVFDFAKVLGTTGDGIGSLFDIFAAITKAGGRMSIGNVPQSILGKLTLVHLADILGADQTMKGAAKKLRRKRTEFTPKERKALAYTSSPCHFASTLCDTKCGYQFIWFGGKQLPRFCPGCGRSTKK
jgi:anti-anti-sigma regulatory factor